MDSERIAKALERIADAQEGMLGIAAEARVERLKLSDAMKKRFQAGFQGGPDENPNTRKE
jgi:hypothetical protein